MSGKSVKIRGDSRWEYLLVINLIAPEKNARCRFRTYDPRRVKAMLYH
jgi:hypothetical protein